MELFRSALKLADNRGLLKAGGPELATARQMFADDLRDLVRRVRVLRDIGRADQPWGGVLQAAARDG